VKAVKARGTFRGTRDRVCDRVWLGSLFGNKDDSERFAKERLDAKDEIIVAVVRRRQSRRTRGTPPVLLRGRPVFGISRDYHIFVGDLVP